jgi:hypothetical protein
MLSPVIRAILPDRVRLMLGIARHGGKLPLEELRALRLNLDGLGGQGMHGQRFRVFAEDGLSPHTLRFPGRQPLPARTLLCREERLFTWLVYAVASLYRLLVPRMGNALPR